MRTGQTPYWDYAWKLNGRKMPWWVSFTQAWCSKKHIGRFWKRKLSKARRRAWQDPHERGLVGWESTANYKRW